MTRLLEETAPRMTVAPGRAEDNGALRAGRRRPDWRPIVSNVCALGVAGVFLYAAGLKILDPRQFVMDIKNYRIMPEWSLNLMALLLPWWEAGAALALILPRTRRAGAMLIAGMLVMFIAAVSYAALYKGYHISCGCFGKKGSTMAGLKTIALDVGLLLGTWLSCAWMARPRRVGAMIAGMAALFFFSGIDLSLEAGRRVACGCSDRRGLAVAAMDHPAVERPGLTRGRAGSARLG
jgi:hypothetical protein